MPLTFSELTDNTDNGDNINHGGDQICRNVTMGPCESTACVDLIDVFNIANDNEFHHQSFNVSLLPNTSRDSDDIGKLKVFTEVRECIRENDGKCDGFSICVLVFDHSWRAGASQPSHSFERIFLNFIGERELAKT